MNNNKKKPGPPEAGDTASGELGGIVIMGPDDFQQEILALVDPLALQVLARFDLSEELARKGPPPSGGSGPVVLFVTGSALPRLLRQRRRLLFPTTRIIVVSPLEEMPAALNHLERGELLDLLLGCIEPHELDEKGRDLLRLAGHQLCVLPAALVHLLGDPQRQKARLARLDPQDREVLALIMTGANNAEIAEILELPLGRVRNQVRGILAKLGCRSRTAAAIMAYRYLERDRPRD